MRYAGDSEEDTANVSIAEGTRYSTKRMKDLMAMSLLLRVRAPLPRSLSRRWARKSSTSCASRCSSVNEEGDTPSRVLVNSNSSLNA